MPILLRNLAVPLGDDESRMPDLLSRRLGVPPAEIIDWELLRKGIDARRKGRISFILTCRVTLGDELSVLNRLSADPDIAPCPELPRQVFPKIVSDRRIVIVGAGPAGLFAALRLTDHGLAPVILERGKPVAERLRDVQAFWRSGQLDEQSNVQFGEGGAGTFSDGKLTTRVRDRNIDYVLDRLVFFGAPQEIRYLAKPHIGTDRLRSVVTAVREHLERCGCRVRFSTCMSGIMTRSGQVSAVIANARDEIPCDALILAPGNSCRDTYALVAEQGVLLEQKPFAVGLRVEHPQELINSIQYGVRSHPQLPPADYALAYNEPDVGRSAYSFCMCPGGVVVASASEAGGVVTNGMSNHLRNSPWANSALVVTVGGRDFADGSPLAGIRFQRDLERRAYAAGGGGFRAPSQNLMAFMGNRGGGCRCSYRPGTVETDLDSVLPPFVSATLRNGISHFNRKMKGFMTREATLTGVETRTSAPVRIIRGADCQSVSLQGLYPAGEGAGYAGGIMSAALDGIRVADAIVARLSG